MRARLSHAEGFIADIDNRLMEVETLYITDNYHDADVQQLYESINNGFLARDQQLDDHHDQLHDLHEEVNKLKNVVMGQIAAARVGRLAPDGPMAIAAIHTMDMIASTINSIQQKVNELSIRVDIMEFRAGNRPGLRGGFQIFVGGSAVSNVLAGNPATHD